MKKKILAIALVVCLAVVAVAGTSLAYLTDKDEQVNVMTVGRVDIEQNEQQRAEDGSLENFSDYKDVFPAATDPKYDETDKIVVGGVEYKSFASSCNAVDKIVTVTNTGDYECYVRTIVAFEHTDFDGNGDYNDGIAWDVHFNYNQADWAVEYYGGTLLDNINVNGKAYSLVLFTYTANDGILPKDETTAPSLLQVFFDKTVTNEEITKVGKTYDILVLSQAVQTKGFANATEALNAAFGEISATNADKIASWLQPMADSITN